MAEEDVCELLLYRRHHLLGMMMDQRICFVKTLLVVFSRYEKFWKMRIEAIDVFSRY